MSGARARDESGASLPELLVGMLVGSVVLAGVATVYVGSLRTTQTSTDRAAATADARVAMEAVTRRLRVAEVPPSATTPSTATALVEAAADRVTFYASVAAPGSSADPAPTRVQYRVDTAAGCLQETLTPASGTAPGYTWLPADERTRCVVLGVVNQGGAPLFQFFRSATEAIPLTLQGGVLPPADLGLVQSVQVDLSVRTSAAATGQTARARNRVTLVNVASSTASLGA